MLISTKLILTGLLVCVSSATIGWGIIPAIVREQISKVRALVPGTNGRKIFEKLPFPLHFKAYIFNVTNIDEVHRGGVAQLEEIGPICFDEWKERVNLVDDEETDTVRYNRKSTWVFNEEKSSPYTGKETVFIPHPILMAMTLIAEKNKPLFLGIVNKAIPYIFNEPSTIFLKTTPLETLFTGITFNCSAKHEFSVNTVCNVLTKLGGDIFEKAGEDLYKFSFFGMRNGTAEKEEWRVKRGSEHIEDIGQTISFNKEEQMSIWNGAECNKISGTDGSIFPPFIDKQPLNFFIPQLCRTLTATFKKPSFYKTIPAKRYEASFSSNEHKKESCFCLKDDCPPKGVIDLSKCMGIPVFVSHPHFLNADSILRRNVRGLHPNENKHGIAFDLEALTGIPLNGRVRVQFSFPLHSIDKINLTWGLPNMLLPFFWFEDGTELNEVLTGQLNKIFSALKGGDILKWVATGVGTGLTLLGAGMRMIPGINQSTTLQITPSITDSSKQKSSVFSVQFFKN